MSRSLSSRTVVSMGILLVFAFVSCRKPVFQSYTTVKYQPAGALQLDPGVFLDTDSLAALGAELGDVVDVLIDGQQLQANVYPYTYEKGTLGMNRFMLQRLQLESGSHAVFIAKATKPTIAVQRLTMHGESYPGDIDKWGHFVISAPHGDCDLFTGEVVQTLNQDYGIPTSAFYYPRFTFLGRWFDANRPLGKAPREDGHWTIPERIWNAEIDSVYHSYENIIRETARVSAGQPLDFVCSFHGHDLKMKDAEGNRINREVIEAYGSGFSQAEYRTMIKWFNEIGKKYFTTLPMLVFGNLPEHQEYEINGQTFGFWYTGLGTRTYGTLRKSNTIRGLHMETPNSMRFDPDDRANTAKLLGEFFERIHANLLTPLISVPYEEEDYRPTEQVIDLPAATFMYRNKAVAVSAMKMSATEVTIGEFVLFLNEKLVDGTYLPDLEERRVVDVAGKLVCHFDSYSPGDMLRYEKGIFLAAEDRQYFPQTNMTWFAAKDYAEFVGGRLPTETEWVRAAGFWDESLHTYACIGKEYSQLDSMINFDGSAYPPMLWAYPHTIPVGKFMANPNGLHEMSGNVWEWCSDWFNSKYYRDLAKDETHMDPQGPDSGTMRTFKGGSWAAGLDVTKVAYRVALSPELALADLGFRVVWDK